MKRDSKLVYSSGPSGGSAPSLAPSAKLHNAEKAPQQQAIRVGIDRKRRKGKTVTVATGFALSPALLTELAGELKKRCGAGGTAKEGEIEVQGDHVATVIAELEKRGFRVKKVG